MNNKYSLYYMKYATLLNTIYYIDKNDKIYTNFICKMLETKSERYYNLET